MRVKIDDEPAAVTAPDLGKRDDSAVTHTIKVIVTQKEWDTDLPIGKYRQEDGNVLENGRLIAPQDQRVNPATPETITVTYGAMVNLEVEAATDVDHWEGKYSNPFEEDYEEDNVTYTWSATGGTVTPDPADPKKATWEAPNDDGDYTVKVTIDDEPKAIPADEDGARDDDPIERSVKIKVASIKIEWKGLARAVAGGIAVDGVHDFKIEATVKDSVGNIMPNTPLKFSFENNKGHNYQAGERGDNQTGVLHRAKYLPDATTGQVAVTGTNDEEMTVMTDAEGKVKIHVLGSDIIFADIKIVATWKSAGGEGKEAGTQTCQFAPTQSRRGFIDPANPNQNEDNGWIFDIQRLRYNDNTGNNVQIKDTATASVYLQYKIDYNGSDDATNWARVNGHEMLFAVDKINPCNDKEIKPDKNLYVYFTPTRDDGATFVVSKTVGNYDGVAAAIVKSGPKVSDAETIEFIAYDQSQWRN